MVTAARFDSTYTADGQIQTWTQQADAQTRTVRVTEYHLVDQLPGLTVRINTVARAILKRFVYGYDPAGNRTSETIGTSGASSGMSAAHNSLNQLIALSAGGPVRFRGRLSETGQVAVAGSQAAVTAGTNFVGGAQTSVGTNVLAVVAADSSGNARTTLYRSVVASDGASKTLTYDLNGNLTTMVSSTVTNTYQRDAVDRLAAIIGPTNRSEFACDGFGRRAQVVEKQNGVVVSSHRYVWCGPELCEERDATGATVTKRFFGQGEQIPGASYFLTRDHLGFVRELADASAAIRARYDYDPYGRRTRVQGNLDADFGFSGDWVHAASGLQMNAAQGYDADLGRSISPDPAQGEDGMRFRPSGRRNPVNPPDAFWSRRNACFADVPVNLFIGVTIPYVGLVPVEFRFVRSFQEHNGWSWDIIGWDSVQAWFSPAEVSSNLLKTRAEHALDKFYQADRTTELMRREGWSGKTSRQQAKTGARFEKRATPFLDSSGIIVGRD